jgi:hypothetical protein
MRAPSRRHRAILCAAAALALAPSASANEDAAFGAEIDQTLAKARPGQFVRLPTLGPSRRSADGLLEVRLPDGQVVKTHGVDPAPAREPAAAAAAAHEAVPERGLTCTGLPRLTVLYVHPADRPDRWSSEMGERIARYLRQMSHRLHADALRSSQGRIGADYRFRCNSRGTVEIRRLRSTTTAAEDDWSVIQHDLKRAGYDSTRGKYLIWYDDPTEGGCGIANIWRDDRKSTANRNNEGPRYGLVYGNTSRKTCWTWRVGMHENAHNMGAVQYAAPRSSGDKAHCNDGRDVMCYADGGDKSDYSTARCSLHVFDCGSDTYFDTLTERGEWLRDRWNLGWSGNRYLDFLRVGTDGSAGGPAPAG